MASTIITTLYRGDAVRLILSKYKPNRLIVLKATQSYPEDAKKVEAEYSKLRIAFPKTKFSEIRAPMYDLVEITKVVVDTIKKETAADIYLHVTEARKTMMLGMLYAGYVMKHKIRAAYYATEEAYEIISLPLPDFSISGPKKRILQLLSQGKTPKQICKLIKGKDGKPKSTAIIYAHIKEMKQEGFLKGKHELTDAGRIVLL